MTQFHLYAPKRYPAPKVATKPKHAIRPRRSAPSLGWWLSGIALATLALVPQQQLVRWLAPLAPQTQQTAVNGWPLTPQATASTPCQTMVNKEQRLSRDQLNQFLSLAQGTEQATVHGNIAAPYCVLSPAEQPKQQQAYPLAFDPNTWFVVNYDQGKYTDFDFVFKQ
ncbi:hypothetical protein [Leptothoe kymatousa]|uniref:Uncharacterized protein n=1 Tax=Leptothoe kymatousa TAU-MAC 1615 TaxID=2364775 RepID=A0ABS5Y135_9CYAN|nr:hypothetical protein [Leptothoe kymatousa]MBT9311547.1 hypothetical protein [Leptothoe kymatousa TAU-MAC 1615]